MYVAQPSKDKCCPRSMPMELHPTYTWPGQQVFGVGSKACELLLSSVLLWL